MLCQSLYYKDSYSRIILELQLTLEAIYQQIPNCAVCSLKDPVGSPHIPSGRWSRMGGERELPPHINPPPSLLQSAPVLSILFVSASR